MAGLPGDVPEAYRIGLGRVPQPGHAGDSLGHLALRRTGSTQPAQVAFDIGCEYGHPCVAERFCQVLQGHGLAGTRGARHQAMAVGQPHRLPDWLAIWASTHNYGRSFRHLCNPLLKLCLNSADTFG